ncbi:MAG: tripartite tricarboxylate transporter TctB family protein [Deltaproteobacteria bacterium]|nr:tripartite tricarboxylate transporter TctB family protein [Deltaproteobacteria bacterium]
MRRGEIVCGILMMGFAVFYIYLSWEFPIGFVKRVPGSGMLPFILGITLLLLSVLYLLRSWKKAPKGEEFWAGDIKSLVICLVFYLGFIVSIRGLGFILSSFFFGLMTLRFLFKMKWPTSIFCSAAFTLILQVSFYNLLGVPLPKGLSWKILSALGLGYGG